MKDGFWFQAGRDDTIGKESGVCVCVCVPRCVPPPTTHRGSVLFLRWLLNAEQFTREFYSFRNIVNSSLITLGWPAERTNN